MNSKNYLPPTAIANYVHNILVIENYSDKSDFVLPLYANGCPAIIFQTEKACKKDRLIGNFTLYGQTIIPDRLNFKGSFTLIAYFLQPHTLKNLLGIQANELTDQILDINYIKQAKAINLQEQLLNESDLQARMQLINHFIYTLMQPISTDNKILVVAINELKKINNVNSLLKLQKKLNITERSLQRLFSVNVGISPNMYKRVCQFNSAFTEINGPHITKLSDIAYRYSFSDHSHFTRVFKEFTQIAPKEYLAMREFYTS
ncbi:MAG: AraC family transcriptional regulator [Taibaiella sp.]|nr:AraC family transcriptional regulator [Taibaiella sp.]